MLSELSLEPELSHLLSRKAYECFIKKIHFFLFCNRRSKNFIKTMLFDHKNTYLQIEYSFINA